MTDNYKTVPGDPAGLRIQRPAAALAMLGCTFLFMLIVTSVIVRFLHGIIERPEPLLRISTLLQDLLVFILPAILTAMLATRLPARLLAVDSLPSMRSTLLGVATLICSIPAMNLIIAWNESWHLPESMTALDQFFRGLEEGARASTATLINGVGIPSLIVSILIVGVLAGFSEELFFRGALQRLFRACRLSHHIAIWAAAFIFSACHLQLFGFIPRMLLGAFFGYTLYWSGSLWLPILLHVTNNTLVVVAQYLTPTPATSSGSTSGIASEAATSTETLAEIGSTLTSTADILTIAASLLLTIAGLWLLHRNRTHPVGTTKS